MAYSNGHTETKMVHSKSICFVKMIIISRMDGKYRVSCLAPYLSIDRGFMYIEAVIEIDCILSFVKFITKYSGNSNLKII